MEFIYMDESGKNILSQADKNIFMFGGLIINKDKVFDALNSYKNLFQFHRNAIKDRLNVQIVTSDKQQRIQRLLKNFELHAVKLFNPTKEKYKDGVLVEENVWKYYPATERFRLINDVFSSIAPYITKIIMFKVEKAPFLKYCTDNGIVPSDVKLTEDMIDFITSDYHTWLRKNKKKGTIITDRLDPDIRDTFVSKIHSIIPEHYWTEPVTVESHTNAFTQIIDIITYCYYIVKTNANTKDNFEAVKRVYNYHIKGIMEEKDLVDYLSKPRPLCVKVKYSCKYRNKF